DRPATPARTSSRHSAVAVRRWFSAPLRRTRYCSPVPWFGNRTRNRSTQSDDQRVPPYLPLLKACRVLNMAESIIWSAVAFGVVVTLSAPIAGPAGFTAAARIAFHWPCVSAASGFPVPVANVPYPVGRTPPESDQWGLRLDHFAYALIGFP